jgi:hypothetical protein
MNHKTLRAREGRYLQTIWDKVVVAALVLLALFFILVWRFGWDWTGMRASTGTTTTTLGTSSGTSSSATVTETQPGKKLWDVLELLIIPAVLALGALWFNQQERKSERETQEKRTQIELEIARDRRQENALQMYLDRISDLLLKEGLRTDEEIEVRAVARARTRCKTQGAGSTVLARIGFD